MFYHTLIASYWTPSFT
jgi:hypothetical protein